MKKRTKDIGWLRVYVYIIGIDRIWKRKFLLALYL